MIDKQLKLLQSKKIIVCTASMGAKLLTEELSKLEVHIEMYLDNDIQKQGTVFNKTYL